MGLRADRLLGRLTLAARPGGPMLRVFALPRWVRIAAAGALRAPAEDAITGSYPAAPAIGGRPAVSWGSARVLTVVSARRELALAVLSARVAARSAVSGLDDVADAASGAAHDDTVLGVSSLLHLLELAQDRAGDLSVTRAYAAGMPSGAGAPPAITLRPRAVNEVSQIAQHIRAGLPVIVSLVDLSRADAQRLADFAAGFIVGVQGSISRMSGYTVLLLPPPGLLPPNDARDARYLAELQAALPAAIASVREVLHGVMGFSPPAPRPSQEGSRASEIAGYASRLSALSLPLNLAGIDLTGTAASLDDLTGAIWTVSTTWPSAEIAEQARAISDELSPGIYQVPAAQRHAPTSVFLPG